MSNATSSLILVLIAILLPPVAVFMIAGCGCDLLLSIILTILGYIPGHIHAFWLIYKRAKAEETLGKNQNLIYVGGGQYAPAHETSPLAPGGIPPANTVGAGGRGDVKYQNQPH